MLIGFFAGQAIPAPAGLLVLAAMLLVLAYGLARIPPDAWGRPPEAEPA